MALTKAEELRKAALELALETCTVSTGDTLERTETYYQYLATGQLPIEPEPEPEDTFAFTDAESAGCSQPMSDPYESHNETVEATVWDLMGFLEPAIAIKWVNEGIDRVLIDALQGALKDA